MYESTKYMVRLLKFILPCLKPRPVLFLLLLLFQYIVLHLLQITISQFCCYTTCTVHIWKWRQAITDLHLFLWFLEVPKKRIFNNLIVCTAKTQWNRPLKKIKEPLKYKKKKKKKKSSWLTDTLPKVLVAIIRGCTLGNQTPASRYLVRCADHCTSLQISGPVCRPLHYGMLMDFLPFSSFSISTHLTFVQITIFIFHLSKLASCNCGGVVGDGVGGW